MKGLKKKLSVAAIALVAVAAVAGTSVTADAAAKKPTKITLKATSKTVDIKGKVTVSVKSVKPAKASKSVTWKSSNKKIATVSSKGVVAGKKAGTVKVTATSKANKKVKATITVKVKNLKPSKVSLSSKTASLEVGKSKTLKATVKPVGVYNKGITWKSSNTKVATVKSGKVTAVAAGKATISATTKEGNKTAKCTVTVTEKAAEVTPTPTPEEVQPIAEPNVTYNKVTAADLKKDITSENPEYIVVDVRKAADYATSHVITSISADVDSALPTSEELAAGRTVNAKAAASAGLTNIKAAIAANTANKKYAIICYSGNKYARAATTLLIASGVDNSKIFTLDGGMKEWNKANSAYTVSTGTGSDGNTYNYITAVQLKADIDSGSPVYKILDVRMKSKYAEGHIKGAVSASVNEIIAAASGAVNNDGSAKDNLAAAIADDKANVKYVLVCNSGKSYAQAATKILVNDLKISSSNIITLTGGMTSTGWTYDTVK